VEKEKVADASRPSRNKTQRVIVIADIFVRGDDAPTVFHCFFAENQTDLLNSGSVCIISRVLREAMCSGSMRPGWRGPLCGFVFRQTRNDPAFPWQSIKLRG